MAHRDHHSGPGGTGPGREDGSADSRVYVTAEEVADLLRISTSQVYRLRHDPGFPPTVTVASRAVRWKWSDIVEWADQGGLQPHEPTPTILGVAKRRGPQRRG
jgi:predicted DNA-binding transcriptional regulator AlpA